MGVQIQENEAPSGSQDDMGGEWGEGIPSHPTGGLGQGRELSQWGRGGVQIENDFIII